MRTLIVAVAFAAATATLHAGDRAAQYQMGTYISADAVEDGTLTSTIRGDGTTVAGGVYANKLTVYKIRVADGTWVLTTLQQNQDSMLRNMGMTPMHFKSEKPNPLDGLRNGDKVLFRVYERHYLNGKFTQVAVPYAENIKKEVDYSARFVPDIQPERTTPEVRSNVQAMCDSGKLTSEQKAQFCNGVTVNRPDPQLQLTANSLAGMASPAAAAAIAVAGRQLSQPELAELVKEGKASRCAIVTSPPGAEVSIDGNKAGITPFAFVLVKRDTPRLVTIKLDGYKTVERQFDPDGKTIPLAVTMEK